jgi:hypothetical protein
VTTQAVAMVVAKDHGCIWGQGHRELEESPGELDSCLDRIWDWGLCPGGGGWKKRTDQASGCGQNTEASCPSQGAGPWPGSNNSAPTPPSRVTCYPRTLDDKFFGSLWKGVYWQMALARAAGLQPFFRETHHFHIFQGIKRTWKHFRACLGNVPYCIVPSSGCPPPALRGGGSHTPFHSGIWAEGDRFFLVSVSVLRCVLCPNRVTLTRPQEISCH